MMVYLDKIREKAHPVFTNNDRKMCGLPMRRKKNKGKKRLTRNDIVETLDSLFEWFDAK